MHTGKRGERGEKTPRPGFKSASPSRGWKKKKSARDSEPPPPPSKASRHVWRTGPAAGGNEFTETSERWNGRWTFLRLPVKTPTRIWWSWFVKIIPSDAMFSSAVARTENSRQGPEPIASNLVGRGRGGGGRGGGGSSGGGLGYSKKIKNKKIDERSRTPSDHRDTYR